MGFNGLIVVAVGWLVHMCVDWQILLLQVGRGDGSGRVCCFQRSRA